MVVDDLTGLVLADHPLFVPAVPGVHRAPSRAVVVRAVDVGVQVAALTGGGDESVGLAGHRLELPGRQWGALRALFLS